MALEPGVRSWMNRQITGFDDDADARRSSELPDAVSQSVTQIDTGSRRSCSSEQRSES
jgi:hypothetical protein